MLIRNDRILLPVDYKSRAPHSPHELDILEPVLHEFAQVSDVVLDDIPDTGERGHED